MVDLDYGPVVVEDWFEETRIGYYDNDETGDDGEECAVVYFGDMGLALHIGYYMIPYDHIREVTTYDLWRRRDEIGRSIGSNLLKVPKEERPEFEERFKLLLELAYVDGVLMDRLYMARFNMRKGKGRRIFISHSSKDKQFAKWLSVDLANAGHEPWLDEWSIKVGESIPTKISDALEGCHYVAVVLSSNSVSSNWVEREWQAKYWNEVQINKVMVLPILLEECEIPILLQTKKYANFTEDYQEGLEEVLSALYVDDEARDK